MNMNLNVLLKRLVITEAVFAAGSMMRPNSLHTFVWCNVYYTVYYTSVVAIMSVGLWLWLKWSNWRIDRDMAEIKKITSAMIDSLAEGHLARIKAIDEWKTLTLEQRQEKLVQADVRRKLAKWKKDPDHFYVRLDGFICVRLDGLSGKVKGERLSEQEVTEVVTKSVAGYLEFIKTYDPNLENNTLAVTASEKFDDAIWTSYPVGQK